MAPFLMTAAATKRVSREPTTIPRTLGVSEEMLAPKVWYLEDFDQ